MIRIFKRNFLLITSAFLLVATPVVSQAAGSPATNVSHTKSKVKVSPVKVQYNFDGQEFSLPSELFTFIYKGTTYVPVRFVSYALQKNVQWDNKSKKLSISEPTEAQKVAIRERMMNWGVNSTTGTLHKSVTVMPVQVDYQFNGTTMLIPSGQFSFSYADTLYVPLRFVSEALGMEITWNSIEKRITGKSAAYAAEEDGVKTPSKGSDNSGLPNSTGSSSSPTTGGNGDEASSSSYESITIAAETRLNELYNRSKSELFALAQQYLSASNSADKARLLAQGESKLSSLTSEFESIMSNTENQLKAGGHNTDIINQYRDRFNSEIEAGRQLAESLGG